MDGVAQGGGWGVHAAASPVVAAIDAAQHLHGLHAAGTVPSTQDVARELAASGAPGGTVVIADRQTAGRGRRGRPWDDDPSGGSLALTVLLDVPTDHVLQLHLLPHALGLAVVDAVAVDDAPARRPVLKWPNDVVVVRDLPLPASKLAGILVERERVPGGVEGEAGEVLLCGVGVNVDLGRSPADRTDVATLHGAAPDRAALLVALITSLDRALGQLAATPGELLDRYRQACATIGREVTVVLAGDERLHGTAVGIDEDGRLLVSDGARIHAILSGTVRDREQHG